MSYKVVEYLREDGTSPYEEWFMGLDTVAAAKITTVKLKMEQGNLSKVKWFRGIGEYRLDWGPDYRVYIGRDGERLIILLGGGTKKGQQKDIDRAETIWEDYKKRKAGQKKK
ncbi:MAG TPA: addiction module protein [Desulfobulbaceae bacterium]|nr:MAG: addiction module protein [Deltaproteobacteria bacterium RIFOXYD12_FULL_53_23]HCC53843.1 addiction module protein [Desulfobulbaceae bacterium]